MENPQNWNSVYYLVSEVYRATGKIRRGDPEQLGCRIRRTAISVTAAINTAQTLGKAAPEGSFYPILSALSVLEAYLELARKHGILKEPQELFQQIMALKLRLNTLIEERREGIGERNQDII